MSGMELERVSWSETKGKETLKYVARDVRRALWLWSVNEKVP